MFLESSTSSRWAALGAALVVVAVAAGPADKVVVAAAAAPGRLDQAAEVGEVAGTTRLE